jgi:hypothetical protein
MCQSRPQIWENCPSNTPFAGTFCACRQGINMGSEAEDLRGMCARMCARPILEHIDDPVRQVRLPDRMTADAGYFRRHESFRTRGRVKSVPCLGTDVENRPSTLKRLERAKGNR